VDCENPENRATYCPVKQDGKGVFAPSSLASLVYNSNNNWLFAVFRLYAQLVFLKTNGQNHWGIPGDKKTMSVPNMGDMNIPSGND